MVVLNFLHLLQGTVDGGFIGQKRVGDVEVEQPHALARDVFYGRRGLIDARELWEQMNT